MREHKREVRRDPGRSAARSIGGSLGGSWGGSLGGSLGGSTGGSLGGSTGGCMRGSLGRSTTGSPGGSMGGNNRWAAGKAGPGCVVEALCPHGYTWLIGDHRGDCGDSMAGTPTLDVQVPKACDLSLIGQAHGAACGQFPQISPCFRCPGQAAPGMGPPSPRNEEAPWGMKLPKQEHSPAVCLT